MNRKLIAVVLVALMLPLFALAQDDDDANNAGRNWEGYTIHQSIEFGGRVTSVNGNQDVYDTFVNLQSGPRLLSQELSMQAAPGTELLFDKLDLSSFGLGGDPNQAVRLRMQKSQWYDLVGSYRRDQNFWDYNLFANPLTTNGGESLVTGGFLNPQSLPWYTNSPHMQNETRNMGDLMLTLFPQSSISVRLGYSINDNHGFFDSTLESSQIPIGENAGWRAYRYQVGVDLKMLPKTTVSIDQFFDHEVTDTNYVPDTPLFKLGSATTAQLGYVDLFNIPSTCVFSSSSVVTAGTACAAYLAEGPAGAFFKTGVVSTNIPSTHLALRSNYFRKLDITADGNYSEASAHYLGYREFENSTLPNLAFGIPQAQTVSTNADLGLTYHFTRSWSFNDKFRWVDWRENGFAPIDTFTCGLASPATTLTNTAGALNPIGNPCNSIVSSLLAQTISGVRAAGTYSSLVDYSSEIGERSFFNTSTIDWQGNRRVSAFAGLRYAQRDLTLGTVGTGDLSYQATTAVTTTAAGLLNAPTFTVAKLTPVATPRINQYTGLAGVVLRPTDAWRINADTEITYADNAFVNLYPRHEQKGRINTSYKVNRWSTLNASVNVTEDRNNFAENFGGPGVNLFPTSVAPAYGSKTHFRYYTVGATLNPDTRVMVDMGWTRMDQKMETATCMPTLGTVVGVTQAVIVGGTPPPCPALTGVPSDVLADAGGGEPLTLDYTETTDTFYTNFILHPVKRVTANLGYAITSDNGNTLWLRADNGQPLQVYGDVYGNAVGLGTLTFTPPTNCNGTAAKPGACYIYAGPNPNQPSGPQTTSYHTPFAGLEVALAKGVSFKGGWAYYDYNEKCTPGAVGAIGGCGPVLPLNFHANTGTLSLKYAF